MKKNINIDVNKLYRNIDIVDEAVNYGYELCQNNKIAEVISLLDDLTVLLFSIESTLAKSDTHLDPLAIICCKNMRNSISNFKESPNKRLRIYSWEIMNLAWNLKNIINNQYKIIDNDTNKNNAAIYLNRALQMHEQVKKNKNKQYKYKASIIVVGYNKVEYTKAAIESIYKYTDFSKDDIELITWNNGSSDETEQYFESLPNTKKINYKYNALGTTTFPSLFEGKYIVCFSNDVVATPNWLEHLIKCIESADDIIAVVPTCQNYAVSCNQGIPVDYQNKFADLDKMEKFAARYNKSNPLLWEERSVLMPFVAVYRHERIEAALTDPCYIQAQFVDDDISTVYRRTGWKQILAKDTFMHHFGSVTLGDSNIISNNAAFINMRRVYFNKWSVDAWRSRGIISGASAVFEWADKSQNDNVLWINPLFGYDFLTLKNQYKKNGFKIGKLKAIVTDKKYQDDAKAYFNELVIGEDILSILEKDKNKYNIITMSCYFNELANVNFVDKVKAMYEHLADDGVLIMPVKNVNSADSIMNFVAGSGRNAEFEIVENYNSIDISKLLVKVKESFADIEYKIFNVVNDNKEIVDRVVNGINAMNIKLDNVWYENSNIDVFWLCLRKM